MKTLEDNGWTYNSPSKSSLLYIAGLAGIAWSTSNADGQEVVLVFDNTADATTASNDMTQYAQNHNDGEANVYQNGVVVTVNGPTDPSAPINDPVVDAVMQGSPAGNPA